jgi:hypothetical protein
VRAVALQPLGSDVPVLDAAIGGECEDRIVLHAVDEQPEVLLALAQRVLGLPALRRVAHHLGEAAVIAVLVDDGGQAQAPPQPGLVLADEPAFVLRMAVERRGPQQPRGCLFFELLGREQSRDVLAHDVVAAVAEDHLARGIPARDDARRGQRRHPVLP